MVRYFIAVLVALLVAALAAWAAFQAVGDQCAQSKAPIASVELKLSDNERMEGNIYSGARDADKRAWARKFLCDIRVGELTLAVFAFFLVVFAGLLWGVAHRLWLVTRDVARTQKRDAEIMQRAYLSAAPIGISPFDASAHADGHVEIRNQGRVPARKVRWFIDIATSSDFQRAHFPIGTLAGNNTIPSNSDMRQWGRTAISQQEFGKFQENSLCVYVWGTVHYDDGFGNDRHTNFCHRYDARGFSSAIAELPPAQAAQLGRAVISSEGAVYHRYGNDAD